MAVTRKPKPSSASASEAEIATLINKGGSAPTRIESTPGDRPKVTPVALRVPTELIDRLDSSLEHRTVRLPRHTWILEAIAEKLERESE